MSEFMLLDPRNHEERNELFNRSVGFDASKDNLKVGDKVIYFSHKAKAYHLDLLTTFPVSKFIIKEINESTVESESSYIYSKFYTFHSAKSAREGLIKRMNKFIDVLELFVKKAEEIDSEDYVLYPGDLDEH